MQTGNKEFIQHIISNKQLGLLSESASLTSQLSLMLLMHKMQDRVLESTMQSLKENYSRILSIFIESKLQLPEEECEVKEAIDAIFEEGEGAVAAAPTNTTAGIEASTPRIYTKKKTKDVSIPE